MNIIIILVSNPFYMASATANRWLTLIEGLYELGVKIEILITGYYQSKKKKKLRVINITTME